MRVARRLSSLCCGLTALLVACGGAQDRPSSQPTVALGDAAQFDFGKPASVAALPKALREISGMVALDDERVACVQDEKGNLYEARVRDGELLHKRAWLPDGDYEAVAHVDDAWHFARSDGTLLVVREKGDAKPDVEEIPLKLPQKDLEALALDPATADRGARLLLACKEPPEGDKQERDLRYVLAFDPARKELAAEPAWTLSRKAIRAQVAEWMRQRKAADGQAATADDTTTQKPKLGLHVSEIAVQPSTGFLWVLSGPDRALFAVDRDGALRAFVSLDAALLPQPEALAFLPCGDLVVASEGKDGPGGLVRFALRR
jgi:hypothetical protein